MTSQSLTCLRKEVEKLKTYGHKKRVTDMHPDATTVLEFYFLEQAIPDMQRELPAAYLAAAEGELEWWDKQEELPHWVVTISRASPSEKSIFFPGGAGPRDYTLGSSLSASPAVPAIIHSCRKSF